MNARPQRIQLSRRRGFDLQATSRAANGLPAMLVTRPGKWGNPFSIAEMEQRYGLDREDAQARAVALHRAWIAGSIDPALSPGAPPDRASIKAELGGHNLACWCRPGTPCHADTLLDIANGD